MHFENKLDMIKSQLKHYEMFQEHHTVFIKIPSMIDIEQLEYNESNILFHVIDELESDDSHADSLIVLECDVDRIDGKGLLYLLTKLNELKRSAYDI